MWLINGTTDNEPIDISSSWFILEQMEKGIIINNENYQIKQLIDKYNIGEECAYAIKYLNWISVDETIIRYIIQADKIIDFDWLSIYIGDTYKELQKHGLLHQ